jgi:antitoxin component of MazEF toxin-antitoxin module
MIDEKNIVFMRKIQKANVRSESSLSVNLPHKLVEKLELKPKQKVKMRLGNENGKSVIIVEPIAEPPTAPTTATPPVKTAIQ